MPRIHAERTLVVYKLTVNVRRKPDEWVPVDDIEGWHIEELFEAFCREKEGELLSTKAGGRHIRLQSAAQYPRAALARLCSGRSGVAFDVVDTVSAGTISSFDETAASMVPYRFYLSAAHGASYALACVEHVPNAAGDTVLLGPFRDYIYSLVPDVVVKHEPVTIPEALDAFVSVEEVSVKKYLEQSDMGDSLLREGDCVTYSLTHKRGHPFGMDMMKALLDRRGRAVTLVGISGSILDPERDEVSVRLKDKHGRTRRFVVGAPLDMKFREVVTPEGKPPLNDGDFAGFCQERCYEVEERIGRTL